MLKDHTAKRAKLRSGGQDGEEIGMQDGEEVVWSMRIFWMGKR